MGLINKYFLIISKNGKPKSERWEGLCKWKPWAQKCGSFPPVDAVKRVTPAKGPLHRWPQPFLANPHLAYCYFHQPFQHFSSYHLRFFYSGTQGICQLIRDVLKKNGKMWEFWKNRGGSTRIPLPYFTVFYMGDPPKKGPKMQNKP